MGLGTPKQLGHVRQQDRIVFQNQAKLVPAAEKLVVGAHVAQRTPQFARRQRSPISLHGA